MKLVGDVEGEGDLAVLGTIEGDVRIDGALVVELSGVLKGQVQARSLVVRGVLVGDGSAADTVRVEPGGRMVGDARAPRVSIIDGALFRGRVEMTGDAPPRVARSVTRRRSTAGDVVAPSSSGTLTSPGTHTTLPGFAPAARTEPPPPPAVVVAAAPVRRGPPTPSLPALRRTEARRTEN
jgi:cytoskeletal protein CcmA (bactofilin family)